MKARKWIIPAGLFAFVFILAMFVAPTALAGETLTGQTVEIKQGETIPDDLYVFADTVLVNGTIQGDLISFSTKVVIGPTGAVEGDLLAASQVLDIQGVVKDDARVAGAVIAYSGGGDTGVTINAEGVTLIGFIIQN